MEIDILEGSSFERRLSLDAYAPKSHAPFCFLLCFSAGWRNAHLAGGSAFHVCVVVFVFCFVVDFPCYMTTDANDIYFKLLLHICLGA